MSKKKQEEEKKPHVESAENKEQVTNGQTATENQPKEDGQAEQLLAQIAELEEKCADLSDKNLRMMAEFDNYRRRTNKEKLELLDTAGERIFKDMLPLVDDFERAVQMVEHHGHEEQAENPQYAALAHGMELIYKKFVAFLEQNKVTPIATEGLAFNVDEQEAITTFAAGEEKKGMVIDCTQKGYKLGDKVIRFAKVVVGE